MSETAREENPETTPDAGTRYLDDAEEIARVIKILRDQRATIQLHFEDDEPACSARILDVQGNTFLLEDVQPREAIPTLRAGQPFALHARALGIYVHSAGNRVVKADSDRGVPYFHVALPRSILFQQRRKAERFRLPRGAITSDASVTLIREPKADFPMVGRVIDVSTGGCRAEFDSPTVPSIANDELVQACAINIPNRLELNAKAAIRHFSYDKENRKLTCGIELIEMAVPDRRRLARFIQSISKTSEPS